MARIVEARDRFIQTAVFEEEYVGSEGAGFLACHPSNDGGHIDRKVVARRISKENSWATRKGARSCDHIFVAVQDATSTSSES
jgi:hypothetical protein